MPLPSFRNSRSKVRRRRSHHALKAVGSTACQNCGATILPHRACKKCGFYKGRIVRGGTMKDAEKAVEKAVAKKADAAEPKKAPAKRAPRKTAKKATSETAE